MASDKDALEELRAVSNIDEIHIFEHYIYFPIERTSREVGNILHQLGFHVEVRLGADGVNWLVLAKNEMLPTDSKISEVRKLLEAIATKNGGDYDGWEAEVRPLLKKEKDSNWGKK